MQEKIDKLNTTLKYSEQSTTSAQMTLESLRADLQRKENQITNEQHSNKEENNNKGSAGRNETRPDTRLPQSREGGQGPYLRSQDHLGRSSDIQK